MRQRVVLKLDGLLGESKSPGNFDEIELIGFSWGEQTQSRFDSDTMSGTVLINNLTVTKQSDQTSRILMLACAMKRRFAEGRFIIQDFSESGNLLRSMILKLRHILINSVTGNQVTETITLNFMRAKLMLPKLKR